MGRVSTCQKNCNTIDLRGAQVNKQYSNIGSDNGLGPTRRQAIIWTIDDYFIDAYMRHSGPMR